MLISIQAMAAQFAFNLFSAAVILFVGLKLVNFFAKRLNKHHNLLKMDETLKHFLLTVFRVGAKVLVFITAIMVAGVPESTFIAILGAAGLAIGLALQGSLSNLAAVVLIIALRPFKVGDFIEGAGHSGTVTEIGLFYSRLTTPDNRAIVIPNSNLTGSSIINYGYFPTRRLDLDFSVDYNSDVEVVKQTLMHMMEKHPLVLNTPEPFVRLGQYGDSSLVFKLRAWVNTEDYWTLYWDLQETAKVNFDAKCIEIPYPHLVIQNKTDKVAL